MVKRPSKSDSSSCKHIPGVVGIGFEPKNVIQLVPGKIGIIHPRPGDIGIVKIKQRLTGPAIASIQRDVSRLLGFPCVVLDADIDFCLLQRADVIEDQADEQPPHSG